MPKKLLLENGAPTAADKRHINEGIEEVLWLAALKPTTIGVPEYRDDVREYLEIAVLRLTLRPTTARPARLVELVHRAVPYPVLLLTEQGVRGGRVFRSPTSAGRRAKRGRQCWMARSWVSSGGRRVMPRGRRSAALALGRQPRTTISPCIRGGWAR